jgi:hypothetical protein
MQPNEFKIASRTFDSSIALPRRPARLDHQTSIGAGRLLERRRGGGFQLNLNSPESLRDEVVGPSPDGAEDESHPSLEKGRKDAEDQQNRSADGADGAISPAGVLRRHAG